MIRRKYMTFVFDCDGVVLNSNKLKTQAFYKAALPYGEAAARTLVDYHVANGGISRYKKFEYFLEKVAQRKLRDHSLATLLSVYATEVRKGLLTCEVAEGLHRLRDQTQYARWLIVSGGDQQELREVFAERDLEMLFDGGIFGSPASKDEILAREMLNRNIVLPGVYFGDSRYDHVAASKAGLDFIFITQWTEFSEWNNYCEGNTLPVLEKIGDYC